MNTLEAALVLPSLCLVTAGLATGLITLAHASTATTLARDAARLAAIDPDPAHARQFILDRRPDAAIDLRQLTVAGAPAVDVRVTLSTPLLDVTGRGRVLVEPEGS